MRAIKISLIVIMNMAFSAFSFAEVDTNAPVISGFSVRPSAGPAGTTYRITFRLSDPQGLDNIVPILYQLREGIEVIEVPINDKGLAGDLQEGDGIYTGKSVVPKTAAKQKHNFQVFVRDKEGHQSKSLEYSFTVQEAHII